MATICPTDGRLMNNPGEKPFKRDSNHCGGWGESLFVDASFESITLTCWLSLQGRRVNTEVEPLREVI